MEYVGDPTLNVLEIEVQRTCQTTQPRSLEVGRQPFSR
jgi:hypothetical protein